MDKKKKKRFDKKFHLFMIPVYLILTFITYDWISRNYLFSNYDIKKNIAIAEIIKVEPGARTAPSFEYFFLLTRKNIMEAVGLQMKLGNQEFLELEKDI